MNKGISVKLTIGIGDAVQFTSVPENYFKTTGEKLVDVNKHWIFDHNPYILRDVPARDTTELWDYFNPKTPIPRAKDSVFLSLAERHACMVGAKVFTKHPRLYIYEDYPFHKRELILLHTHGKSHGKMPDFVIDHVLKKYHGSLMHVCLPGDPDLGIPKLETPTLWSLVETISRARMFIGMDSGPSWIASCYPDVVVKKLRMKPTLDVLKDWIPQQISNIHSYWDDRIFQVYNHSEDDIGFTLSYKRL
jgi:hypothetical protein